MRIGRHHAAVVQLGARRVVGDDQADDRPVPAHGDLAVPHVLEEPVGGQADRSADDSFHRASGHQPELLQLEPAHRRRPDRVPHVAAQAVPRPVQEPFEALERLPAEERFAEASQQQELEVQHLADLARHLPEQLPGEDVGAGRDCTDLGGDIAGRLAVADREHALVARLFDVGELGGRGEPPAGGGELRLARVGRAPRLAEDAVGDDQMIHLVGAFDAVRALDVQGPP